MKKKNKKDLKRYEKVFCDKLVYEMTQEEKEAPITKEVAETLRHRLEKRWYRRLVELNIIMIVTVVAVFAINFSKNTELVNQYVEQVEEEYQEALEKSSGLEEEKIGIDWAFLISTI